MSRCRRNCLDDTHHRLGKLAYEAYCRVYGVTTPRGWEHLTQREREAWHAAGDAACTDLKAILSARGQA